MPRSAALKAVEDAIARGRQQFSSARNRTFAVILWRFIHDVRIGDRVLTADAEASEVLAGVVDSGYRFTSAPEVSGYHHVRSVVWIGRVPRSELPQQVRRSIGAPAPMYLPAAQAQIASLPIWR